MKTFLVLLSICYCSIQMGYSQIQTRVRPVAYRVQVGTGGSRLTYDEIQRVVDQNNSEGFKFLNSEVVGDGTTILLYFEKTTSMHEAEIQQLVVDLNNRIDTASKKYTDSAMIIINTNVLNYLKKIPNDVITKAYKDELTKTILMEADEKLKGLVEELKREVNKSKN